MLLAPNIIENNLPRSQKVQNLLTAIAKLPDDIEVIAFVDADVAIREDWLRLLVNPLQEPEIGTTVGGRFLFSTNVEYRISCRIHLGQLPDERPRRASVHNGMGRF